MISQFIRYFLDNLVYFLLLSVGKPGDNYDDFIWTEEDEKPIENVEQIIFAPHSWQLYFQESGSAQMFAITLLHNYVMYYILFIFLYTSYTLVLVIYYFGFGVFGEQLMIQSRKKYKDDRLYYEYRKFAKKWKHQSDLEIIWMLTFGLIIFLIGLPSIYLLYALDEQFNVQANIKIIGVQWYWDYCYPLRLPFFNKNIFFNPNDQTRFQHWNMVYSSYMRPRDEVVFSEKLYLLEVTKPVYMPIFCNTRLTITGADVIHSFAVPSLGIKADATPGRIQTLEINIYHPGFFFGQCSELCGVNHAFMPICVSAIPLDFFNAVITDMAYNDIPQYRPFAFLVEAYTKFEEYSDQKSKFLDSCIHGSFKPKKELYADTNYYEIIKDPVFNISALNFWSFERKEFVPTIFAKDSYKNLIFIERSLYKLKNLDKFKDFLNTIPDIFEIQQKHPITGEVIFSETFVNLKDFFFPVVTDKILDQLRSDTVNHTNLIIYLKNNPLESDCPEEYVIEDEYCRIVMIRKKLNFDISKVSSLNEFQKAYNDTIDIKSFTMKKFS